MADIIPMWDDRWALTTRTLNPSLLAIRLMSLCTLERTRAKGLRWPERITSAPSSKAPSP